MGAPGFVPLCDAPGELRARRIEPCWTRAADAFIENRTFDELTIGETASSSHTVTQRDIDLFATVTGDVNPAHVDPAYAETDMFHHIIIQGMWGAGLISAVLGTKLPGPGTIYLGQDLRFRRPVSIGDTITATLTVRGEEAGKRRRDARLRLRQSERRGRNHRDRLSRARRGRRSAVRGSRCPASRSSRHDAMRAILARAAGGAPIATAVVNPVDPASLLAALDAAKAGLIAPVLIGPAARIAEVAKAAGADISALRLIDAPDGRAAAAQAVALARAGEVALLDEGRSAHRRADARGRCI